MAGVSHRARLRAAPRARAASPTTLASPRRATSPPRTGARWPPWPPRRPWPQAPRILPEHLGPLPGPLACLLRPGAEAPPALVAAASARALLDLAPLEETAQAWPSWLAPHQVPAAERLLAIQRRYGGALLADAVGLGKSYVALAVALARQESFALVAPAVLVPQLRGPLRQLAVEAPILTPQALRATPSRPLAPPTAPYPLVLLDAAHPFP